jgi:O-antigen ligase
MEGSRGSTLNFKKNSAHLPGFFIFFLLPFIYFRSAQEPEQMPRLTALSAFLVLGLGGFLLSGMEVRLSRTAVMLNLILLSMLLWIFSGIFFSVNTGDAFSEWLRLAILCCFFFFIYQLIVISPDEMIRTTCRYAATGVFIFSAFAISDVMTGLKNLNGLAYNLANSISSVFSNKNFFSECLVLMPPFLIYGIRSDKWKGIFITALVLDLIFVLILKSSASWIALIATILVYLIIIFSNTISIKKIILFCTLFFTVSIAFIYLTKDKFAITRKIAYGAEYFRHPELINITREENNNSTYERMMLWRNTLSMVTDHPLIGVGLNNWKIYNPAYGIGGTQYTNTGLIVYEHPHNDYLLILAEQGPVGLLLYLFFLAFVLRNGMRIFRTVKHDQKYFIALLISSIVAYAVTSFFSYPRSRVFQTVLLMLTIAVLFSFSNETLRKYSGIPVIVILAFSVIGVYVFASRTLSDIHVRSMVFAQAHRNFPRMEREGIAAESWLFPVDMSATPVCWYIGMARFYENDTEGAKENYEQAFKINPYHLRTINDLATTYERTGHPAEAIGLYRRGLAISPNFIEGNLNISAAYFNAGKIDSAYYFINRIKGLKMSMAEENNYKMFSNVIIHTHDSLMQTRPF